MQQINQRPQPTIQEATYQLLRQLAHQMEPISQLAKASSPNETDPMDTVIQLLRQVVGGIKQVHTRLENLEARLDDPAVVKAIKQAVHG